MEWQEVIVDDYWHVYSDGKRADIPFLTDTDKIYARNSVAICAFVCGVTVLVVTVNETHLHCLIRAREENATRFKEALRLRLISYYKKGGRAELLGEGLFLACDPVPTLTKVKQKFMYVFRNCLDFFPGVPWAYPWGSGNIYFAKPEPKGETLAKWPVRQQRELLQTKVQLPQDWRMTVDGALDPVSFIDYRQVERLFVSVRAFLAFLYVRKDDEAAMKQEVSRNYLDQRVMEDLRGKGNKIAHNYCGMGLLKAPFEVRLKVAGKMIRDGLCGKSETLAKALYLKREDLDRLL